MTLVTTLLLLFQLLFLLTIKLHIVNCQTDAPTIVNANVSIPALSNTTKDSGYKKRTTIPAEDESSKTVTPIIPITTDGDNDNGYDEVPDEDNFRENEYIKLSNNTNDLNLTSTATIVSSSIETGTPTNFTSNTPTGSPTTIADSTYSLTPTMAPTISSGVDNKTTFPPTVILDPNSTEVPTAKPTVLATTNKPTETAEPTSTANPSSAPDNSTSAPTAFMDSTLAPTESSAYAPVFVNGLSIILISTTIATIVSSI